MHLYIHQGNSACLCYKHLTVLNKDLLVVSAPQQEQSVEPSPPLAFAAPPPPFSFGLSPGQHGGRPDRPHPAAALALGSGSSPP